MGERGQSRRSIRLKGYDYRLAGGYFVTVCVMDGKCILADIVEDEMELNSFGQIVDEEWRKLEEIRNQVLLDEYQVMPNHFHGILWLTNEPEIEPGRIENSSIWATQASPLQEVVSEPSRARGPGQDSLGAVIGGFKSASTRRINEARGISGVSTWQRNFWERIIRNERELEAVRKYVRNNPAN